ncbi:hypothetical protein Thiowin_03366 [Thiorhodovibrio winogradskyi]|uniref:Uncharacterized protein n=1 Tax=Thiorhodovibrio winogradskyi TaxID=77007 RepID=A0ABZ0SDA6_9GAMM|nr:hypothetical protein [Thiorhodovibrio winogradskyi]
MPTLDFVEQIRQHVKTQAEEHGEHALDREQRLNWWRSKVDALTTQMKQWLEPLITDETISVRQKSVRINEDRLGDYELPALEFCFGLSSLSVTPVGSVIIGALGRVDIAGPEGKAMLILTADDAESSPSFKQEHARWFISYPEQRLKLFELDESSFRQLIVDLLGVGD